MRNFRVHIISAMSLSGSLLSVLVLGACATDPKTPKDDTASLERGKVYVQNIGVVAASSRDSRGAVCAVPSSLRDANTGGRGESKVWKDLLSRANTCVNDRNWTTLENLANAMAKADLDSPWPAYYLGLAADVRGDLSRAMWMAELALKKSGGKVALFVYQRGRVWMHMQETRKAIVDLQKAVTIEPNLLEGQMYLAEIYNRDQDFDRAAKYYRAALKVDAKNYAALTGLAEIDLTKNSVAEATDLYNRATAEEGNQLLPWLRLVHIYENLQKNPELALNTYKSLKSRIDSGAVHDKPDFDVNARIKAIESSLRARQPASAAKIDDKGSVK